MLLRRRSTVKTKLIAYRATRAEHEAVERAAKKAGKVTVSEWLREVVKKELAFDVR